MVEPLEEEIKALKEKLRSTDDELQKFVGPKSETADGPSCVKCMEWELEAKTNGQQVETLDKQVARLHEDLERESQLRGELEKEWQEKKEQHKEALTELTDQLKKSEEQMFLLTVSTEKCPHVHLIIKSPSAAQLQLHTRGHQPGTLQSDRRAREHVQASGDD